MIDAINLRAMLPPLHYFSTDLPSSSIGYQLPAKRMHDACKE
jgi:hypothetical protein